MKSLKEWAEELWVDGLCNTTQNIPIGIEDYLGPYITAIRREVYEDAALTADKVLEKTATTGQLGDDCSCREMAVEAIRQRSKEVAL